MEPSLLYLQMLPLEQKGWLTLHLKDSGTLTAQGMIGHIGTDSLVVLSYLQTDLPITNVDRVEFRYINQTGIYTLSCKALEFKGFDNGRIRLCMHPPYSMTHLQQREFIRIEPEAPIPLSFTPIYPDDYHSGKGFIKNISGNGLLFATDEFVHNESILSVSFSLPESSAVITGIAQVVRKQFLQDETITSVQFLELSSEFQKEIISFCVGEQLKISQQQHQKRRYVRVATPQPLRVSIKGFDCQQTCEGHALNIGGGGLLIRMAEQIAESPLYQLTLQLPEANAPIQAFMKIVDKNIVEDQQHLHVEFVDIKQEDQEQIINFVLQQQLLLLRTPEQQVTPI